MDKPTGRRTSTAQWKPRALAAEAASAEWERKARKAAAIIAHLRVALRRERAANALATDAAYELSPHDAEAKFGTIFAENYRLPLTSIIAKLEKESRLRIAAHQQIAVLRARLGLPPLPPSATRTLGRNHSIEVASDDDDDDNDDAASSASSSSSSSGILLLPSPHDAGDVPSLAPITLERAAPTSSPYRPPPLPDPALRSSPPLPTVSPPPHRAVDAPTRGQVADVVARVRTHFDARLLAADAARATAEERAAAAERRAAAAEDLMAVLKSTYATARAAAHRARGERRHSATSDGAALGHMQRAYETQLEEERHIRHDLEVRNARLHARIVDLMSLLHLDDDDAIDYSCAAASSPVRHLSSHRSPSPPLRW